MRLMLLSAMLVLGAALAGGSASSAAPIAGAGANFTPVVPAQYGGGYGGGGYHRHRYCHRVRVCHYDDYGHRVCHYERRCSYDD